MDDSCPSRLRADRQALATVGNQADKVSGPGLPRVNHRLVLQEFIFRWFFGRHRDVPVPAHRFQHATASPTAAPAHHVSVLNRTLPNLDGCLCFDPSRNCLRRARTRAEEPALLGIAKLPFNHRVRSKRRIGGNAIQLLPSSILRREEQIVPPDLPNPASHGNVFM